MPGMYCLYVYLPLLRKLSIKNEEKVIKWCVLLAHCVYAKLVFLTTMRGKYRCGKTVCLRWRLSLCEIDDREKREEDAVFVKSVYCVLCIEKSCFLNNAYFFYILPWWCDLVYLYKFIHRKLLLVYMVKVKYELIFLFRVICC